MGGNGLASTWRMPSGGALAQGDPLGSLDPTGSMGNLGNLGSMDPFGPSHPPGSREDAEFQRSGLSAGGEGAGNELNATSPTSSMMKKKSWRFW